MTMIRRFIDFEVTPNWWEVVIGDYVDGDPYDESIKENFITITSDMPNSRSLVIEKFKEPGYVILGWNIKHYDLMIANAIYQGFTAQQVFMISSMIIEQDRKNWTNEHWRLNSFTKKKLAGVVYQDLMDDDSGALKEKQAVIGIDIREYEGDFMNPNLTDEEKAEMTEYCKTDVWSTIYYYVKIRKDYIDTKLSIGETFNVPEDVVYSQTNAGLTGIALKAKYTKFDDELLDRVTLPAGVRQYVYDNVPNKLIDDVMNAPYNIDNKGKISYTQIKVILFDNFITFGNGGMHSVISPTNQNSRQLFLSRKDYKPTYPTYVESCDEWVLMNVDGASFYPSLMIFQGTLSRTIQDGPKYFKELFDRRIALKWKENKTQAEVIELASLKLALNTVFGASGCKWLALYDKYQCTATCRIGQMLLTALANKLYKNIPDLKIIQTNTDGILVYFRRKDIPLVEKYGKEWTDVTNIQLEYEEIVKTWQRDVNNYIIVKTDIDKKTGKNKIKNVGEWLKDDYHKWGYGTVGTLSFYACAKAAISYLIDGTDIVKSLVDNKDLSDFCMYPKKGPSFREVIHRMSDGSEILLNKYNRIYATKDASFGKLYKVKYRLGVKSYNAMPSSPDHCKTLNDALYNYDFKEIRKDIDYMWYIEKTADLLEIDWVPIGKAAMAKDLSQFKY